MSQLQFDRVVDVLRDAHRLVVITGAGCSTPSGIGDYRDEAGEWKRAAPVQHQDFMKSASWRQRYWARSQVGYPEFLRARPNAAHRALASLEQAGRVHGLITQNVDGLHQQAGQTGVIDLHGRLDRVVCMSCGGKSARASVQEYLERHNPPMSAHMVGLAPDGDADLAADDFSHIRVPSCSQCGGVLKPDVVFYGDSVPKPVVAAAYSLIEAADAVLVVGSSLMVYSSFRFVRRAQERALPIVAINKGKTRADHWLHAKAQGDSAQLLALAAQQLI